MNIIPLTGLPSLESIADKSTKETAAGIEGGVPVFGSVLKDAIANMQATQEASANDAYNLSVGKTDDLHTVQINSMKASAAVELTAGITSRALTAYKEILQTQL